MSATSPHPVPGPAANSGDSRYRETVRVTLVGSAVDLALGIAKLLAGYLAQSQALIADGIHSLSDLGTDMVVLVAAKHAHQEADEAHPYGHGRIETLATVGLAVAMLLIGIGIAWDAVERLFETERLLQPGPWALAVAVASVLSKEAVYHYTMRAAKRLRSDMLRANAWHSRSDAISSIVVIIGVGGTMAGLDYFDALAAAAVAVMIAKIAIELGWSSLRELIDTGLEGERVEEIRDVIHSIDGVRDMHMLRTRMMGGTALADVHVQVDPRLSVSEGHQIGETVRARLIRRIDEVNDVTVHIDPENDETNPSCAHLPLRHELLERLQPLWDSVQLSHRIERITLHYLHGKVHLDLLVRLSENADLARMQEQEQSLRDACGSLELVGGVQISYRIAPG